jgi:hypothetical protein
VSTAPAEYALSFTLSRIAVNLPEYLDRTLTFQAVVVLLAALMCRPSHQAFRHPSWAFIGFGGVWWAAALAVTMLIPVRSSLYACLPAVGSALLGAELVERIWSAAPNRQQRKAIFAGLMLPFALWPVYHARNRRWVREAELSAHAITVLQTVAQERGAGATVLLRDDRSARPSLTDAFGGALPRALELLVSPSISAWIDPPPAADLSPRRAWMCSSRCTTAGSSD